MYMYILVEIIHTEFQYISLIEMQKYNWNRKKIEKRKTGKKGTFCPGWCYQAGQKVAFCPGCQTRDKRTPLLSRPGIPCWETETTKVFQPEQISVSVAVCPCKISLNHEYSSSLSYSLSGDTVPGYPFSIEHEIKILGEHMS